MHIFGTMCEDVSSHRRLTTSEAKNGATREETRGAVSLFYLAALGNSQSHLVVAHHHEWGNQRTRGWFRIRSLLVGNVKILLFSMFFLFPLLLKLLLQLYRFVDEGIHV